jgi:uncharacterized small protein (DUF1192 family)
MNIAMVQQFKQALRDIEELKKRVAALEAETHRPKPGRPRKDERPRDTSGG